MSETKRRRESTGAEVLELTEALARIRNDRGRAGSELQEVDGRRRLVVLAAAAGPERPLETGGGGAGG